jgi:hypothetical protein
MDTAPRDGLIDIEVRHGRNQEVVVAHWAPQLQGYIQSDDPLRRVLHMVTGWRPIRNLTQNTSILRQIP